MAASISATFLAYSALSAGLPALFTKASAAV